MFVFIWFDSSNLMFRIFLLCFRIVNFRIVFLKPLQHTELFKWYLKKNMFLFIYSGWRSSILNDLGRGSLAVFVSLRRTLPVDHVFCVVSSIFEVADFKFRCSQVPIPAVFSQFAKQNYFNTTASTPFLIDIDTGSTAYLSILYYRMKHMLYTDYE